ncbi:hypothetical protein EDB81DRAFT_932400 [Dactylonectria macrodidyma]|uniref:Uncharacterized protein n=1 Tax=Dactylonectria macrodidyma TaxID=307937 RepID=A0A9P9I6N7_9HYPO|nr:hypothetical protein EDB81DRAFT_895544 [Dactylonectria macrodidyma]KAH7108685.1 hypothetical protein EDB81DRAFT_932400 [Dactylonectria macrodidyma]
MEPFVHLPEYPFVICKPCAAAFVADEVISHLQAQHTVGSAAQQIHKIVQAIPGIIHNQKELQQWSVPPPTTAPIPIIPPPMHDGFGCNRCPYVARQIQRIQQHCRDEHGWVNDRKRGRRTKAKEAAMAPVPWKTGVQCQRFFRARVASSWFEVGRTVPPSNEGIDEDEATRQAEFIMATQRKARQAMESEADPRIQESSDKWEAERWLKRTGWPGHLAHVDKTRLREQVLQPIGENEPVLQKMWEIFECVLNNAYVATSRCSSGTAELFEIERKEVTVTRPTSHLKGSWSRIHTDDTDTDDADGTDDTDTDYTEDSEESDDPNDDEGGGQRKHRNKKPPYRMTIQQEKAWAIFRRGVTQVVAGTDTIGRFTDERLERYCLDAVIEFFDHPLKTGQHYDSIVISALAVMGLDANGGWVTAANYTPVLSAIIKGTRYLVLYQSMLERHDQITRLQQTMGRRRAKEKADGLFRIIRGRCGGS